MVHARRKLKLAVLLTYVSENFMVLFQIEKTTIFIPSENTLFTVYVVILYLRICIVFALLFLCASREKLACVLCRMKATLFLR